MDDRNTRIFNVLIFKEAWSLMATKKVIADKAALRPGPTPASRARKARTTPESIQQTHIIRQPKGR
jgi:hypothetical protein